MATFLSVGKDIITAMLKIKQVILFLFLFVFTQVNAAPTEAMLQDVADDHCIETCFQANDSFPGLWGDIPAGRICVNFSLTITDCDPGISKSKEVASGLAFSIFQNNLRLIISGSSVFTRQSAVYIPIYLQTATFRL